jgi:hypothetical protein
LLINLKVIYGWSVVNITYRVPPTFSMTVGSGSRRWLVPLERRPGIADIALVSDALEQ